VQDMGIYCNYFDIVILILVNKKKADQSIGIKFYEIIYKKKLNNLSIFQWFYYDLLDRFF
jgi:hypothetical protein